MRFLEALGMADGAGGEHLLATFDKKAVVVQREDGKYELRTADGQRVLGTHDTGPQAYKQEYAIQMAQKRRKLQSKLKAAALKADVVLQPQQERIREEVETGAPVRKMLVHSVGSGKTLTAVAAGEETGEPYAAFVPAALRQNFNKEVEKFTDQTNVPTVESYNLLAKGVPAEVPTTVIMDEAQRLRNPSAQQTVNAKEVARKAKNLLLLTGTPVVNSPADLAPLYEMLSGQPMSPETFKERFIGEETVNPGLGGWLRGVKPVKKPVLRNREQLKAMLKGYVDYHKPKDTGVEQREEIHETPMSNQQLRFYRAFWDQLPTVLRWKLQYDYPLTKQEINNLSSFLAGPRQVGLSILPFMKGKRDPLAAFEDSPKLQKAMQLAEETLKDPNAKVLAFSNFLEAGLEPYAAALAARKIPYGIFHGGLTDADRKRVIEDYNTGKIRHLLIGPSGSEGISTKGTRLIQLLDPHWNKARAKQSIGRGIRFDSHLHLPEDERNVLVQRFRSSTPTGVLARLWRALTLSGDPTPASDPGTDEYLDRMSDKKDDLNEQVMDVIREVGTPT
jgi:hypothetical protein